MGIEEVACFAAMEAAEGDRDDHVGMTLCDVGGKTRQARKIAFCRARIDRHCLRFHIAEFTHAFPECSLPGLSAGSEERNARYRAGALC